MKEIIILVGIPCSGKSTWAKSKGETYSVLSRDTIREKLFGKSYKQNFKDEKLVTYTYNKQLEYLLQCKNVEHVILDNTHCKEGYITAIVSKYSKGCKISIMYFDVPLWKAHIRNILRRITTGKWIPAEVISNMYNSYKTINRKKYEKYMVHE